MHLPFTQSAPRDLEQPNQAHEPPVSFLHSKRREVLATARTASTA